MTNRKARTLRQALDFPRLPRMMTLAQRRAYRQLKAKYAKLSSLAKRTWLDDVSLLRRALAGQPS